MTQNARGTQSDTDDARRCYPTSYRTGWIAASGPTPAHRCCSTLRASSSASDGKEKHHRADRSAVRRTTKATPLPGCYAPPCCCCGAAACVARRLERAACAANAARRRCSLTCARQLRCRRSALAAAAAAAARSSCAERAVLAAPLRARAKRRRGGCSAERCRLVASRGRPRRRRRFGTCRCRRRAAAELAGRHAALAGGALRQAGSPGRACGHLAAAVALHLVAGAGGAGGVAARRGAAGAVLRGRAAAARRRLHGERPLGPRHRPPGGPHAPPPAGQRRRVAGGRARLPRRAAGGGPGGPATAQHLQPAPGRLLAGTGGRLPAHEAHHQLAAGFPRPHLQLGSPPGKHPGFLAVAQPSLLER